MNILLVIVALLLGSAEGQKGGAKGAMRNRGKGGKGRGGGGGRGGIRDGDLDSGSSKH